jgi:hypothetical protein
VLELLFIALFLLWCAAAVCVYSSGNSPPQRSLESIRTELLVADQRIDAEYRQARHAMNAAAGQSWRNLAG